MLLLLLLVVLAIVIISYCVYLAIADQFKWTNIASEPDDNKTLSKHILQNKYGL
jgi:hypothetical protein